MQMEVKSWKGMSTTRSNASETRDKKHYLICSHRLCLNIMVVIWRGNKCKVRQALRRLRREIIFMVMNANVNAVSLQASLSLEIYKLYVYFDEQKFEERKSFYHKVNFKF
jgi:hypothetical protein